MAGSTEIREYIISLLNQAQKRGENSCILVSGDIHREMGLQSRMPNVCGVMYSLINFSYEILETTPSGLSSTIKIEYQLN